LTGSQVLVSQHQCFHSCSSFYSFRKNAERDERPACLSLGTIVCSKAAVYRFAVRDSAFSISAATTITRSPGSRLAM
jgi:hypothetical protein